MRAFSEAVRSGAWTGYTGSRITDVVNIGIGGSDLGPAMATAALEPYSTERTTPPFRLERRRRAHRPDAQRPRSALHPVHRRVQDVHDAGDDDQCAHGARMVLLAAAHDESHVAKHFVAVSTNEAEVRRFGIEPEQMFVFWDWVGGRYSLWSSIGLPVAIAVGFARFEEMLEGAFAMDEHFRTAPIEAEHPDDVGSDRRVVRQRARCRHACRAALRAAPPSAARLPAAARHGKQRQGGGPTRPRPALRQRPDRLGRARNERPARVLPAAAPGHAASDVRLPRRARVALSPGRASPAAAGQLLRANRGADDREGRSRPSAPS